MMRELVQGLFPIGRLSLTHVQSVGYAGFGHSRSQHVEFHLDDAVAEVLASQSTLGHAPRGITRQVCRRLYSQWGGRLPESSSPITSRTRSAPGRQCAVTGGIAHQGCPHGQHSGPSPPLLPSHGTSGDPRTQGRPRLVARTERVVEWKAESLMLAAGNLNIVGGDGVGYFGTVFLQ